MHIKLVQVDGKIIDDESILDIFKQAQIGDCIEVPASESSRIMELYESVKDNHEYFSDAILMENKYPSYFSEPLGELTKSYFSKLHKKVLLVN